MSWIWPDHIPRDLALQRPERKAVHGDAWRLWWANRWNLVIYLTLPTLYLAAVPFASDAAGSLAALLRADATAQKAARAAGPFLLFVLCFVIGGMILQRCRFAPCVYRALRQRGHDVCLKCGYWLRGLNENISRCPECGRQRETIPPAARI